MNARPDYAPLTAEDPRTASVNLDGAPDSAAAPSSPSPLSPTAADSTIVPPSSPVDPNTRLDAPIEAALHLIQRKALSLAQKDASSLELKRLFSILNQSRLVAVRERLATVAERRADLLAQNSVGQGSSRAAQSSKSAHQTANEPVRADRFQDPLGDGSSYNPERATKNAEAAFKLAVQAFMRAENCRRAWVGETYTEEEIEELWLEMGMDRKAFRRYLKDRNITDPSTDDIIAAQRAAKIQTVRNEVTSFTSPLKADVCPVQIPNASGPCSFPYFGLRQSSGAFRNEPQNAFVPPAAPITPSDPPAAPQDAQTMPSNDDSPHLAAPAANIHFSPRATRLCSLLLSFALAYIAEFQVDFPSSNRHFDTHRKAVKSFFICASVLGLASAAFAADLDLSKLPPAAPRKVDFEKEILPIFKESCLQCHSDKKQEGGLRLDIRSAAFRGGENGPVIIPNKSAESVLIHAVAGIREDVTKMPKKGDPLTSEQIGLLRAWIDQGANWPASVTGGAKDPADHWAFKAPKRPALPEVKNKGWVRTPIDAFVLARLEKEGLQPSPEADKITLLRRLSLDLIGLPPTIEEVDAFLSDNSAEAYEKQVERLLKSPHYGERWGRHWLDAARYADSDGFEKDKPRFVWHYRDWVVDAINRDLPYDKFIIEQLAGDQFYNPTEQQLVATGFLRNSMLNEEGGVDPEQFRMDGLFDRMDAIGKSVLGLTIQCAQCHSHKFDPITQEDYYRMFSFLNNDHEAFMVAYTPSENQKRADLNRQMRDIEEGLRHTTADWEERMNHWEDSVKNDQPDWAILRCDYQGDNGERFYYYSDGSIRAASYAPTLWTAHFKTTNNLPIIGAFRLEQLTDPNLPAGGPGRSVPRGMAALTEFTVDAVDASNPTNKLSVKFVKATADFSNPEKELEPEFDNHSGKKRTYGPVEFAIDGKEETAWGIDAGPGQRNQSRKAVFIPEKPLTFTNGVVLTFGLKQNHGGSNSDDNQNNNLGRFRFSVCAATNAVADPLPAAVRDIFNIPREKRSPSQVATIFTYWRTTVPEFKEANDKIAALWKQWPDGETTQILLARKGQGPNQERRTTHMFKRGDWLKQGKEVKFGVPAFLHPLPEGADDSRLTFARWLVDKKSPTTARVCVNRIWQNYFGTGLVETSEDFGMRAPDPTHPELLDWLATELMDPTSGETSPVTPPWSIKHIHRLIVSSAAYKQSSKVTPQLYEKDQFNKLLARGPRFRVEGEIVRDIALASSGLLNPAIGGPSVMPPAPAFLFQPPASYGPKTWKDETGLNRYRRGIYTFRFRSVPYPVFTTFDAPNGDFSCVRRQRSNSPLQALTSLNEIVFVECAQALAQHALEHGSTDEEHISFAFRSCVGRKPEADEVKELVDLVNKEKAHIGEGWVNPYELATGKSELPKNLPKGASPTQLAAYTVVSRVLLNLDETITKE